MGNPEYTQVNSIYVPNSGNCDLIIRADSSGSDEWAYAFYEQSSIPDYMKSHARRHNEAQELEESVKLGRMVESHLNRDAEKEWRFDN